MKKVLIGLIMFIFLLSGCKTDTTNDPMDDNETMKLEETIDDLSNDNKALEEMNTSLKKDNDDLIAAAGNLENQLDQAEAAIKNLEEELQQLQSSQLTPSLLSEASAIITALANEDFTTVSSYVGSNGIRFSPYQYVDTANDQVFTAQDMAGFLALSTQYLWGSYDGSGDPIQLTTSDYFDKFVYDEDFQNAPNIGQNTVLSFGNAINNITTVYPGSSFVEFYFPGFDPQYSGMDWRSLTLVLQYNGSQWELLGIVHGQWTI